jgi:hypothetical protein
MVNVLARRDASSIHLFWAWVGAGKTHTLYYLDHYASTISGRSSNNNLVTVYTEFPRAARTFLDLYKSLSVALEPEILTNAFLEVSTSQNAAALHRRLGQASPDLLTALHVVATGNPQSQSLAQRWLRGDAVPLSDLKKVGIFQRLTTSEEATRVLSSIVEMLALAGQAAGRPSSRLIWMVDEFQRIATVGARGLDDINVGLHSVFNACPVALTLIFSFSGKPQESGLPPWFSRELRDRIGRTKVMVLPPMSATMALRFVRETLAEFRSPSVPGAAPFFPFSDATCKAIIAEVQSKMELKPRALMQAFTAVLEDADPLIEAGKIPLVSPEFALTSLKDHTIVAPEEDLEGGS